jgi:hypothetical protein
MAEEIAYLKLAPDVTAIRRTRAKPDRGYVIIFGDRFTASPPHFLTSNAQASIAPTRAPVA